MDPPPVTAEQKAARIGEGQKGLATRQQLLEAGVSATQIRRRLGRGDLIREFPGVYRVGHRAPSPETHYLAAVLACGEHAVLLGRAAGYRFGLLHGPPPQPEVATRWRRAIAGIATRRLCLDRRDTTVYRGIPTTTVSRTLVDLAVVLSLDELARACHEAGVRFGTTPAQVSAVLARHPNSPGAGRLKRVLEGEVHVTLSKLERRFLSLLREAGLPLPQTNRPAGGRRVDCHWPKYRLTVELDSYTYHRSRHAWEQDRRREREARLRGDEFRRYTWGDVFEHPRLMLRELGALLPSG
jgi:hypothetical protein